MKATGIAVDRLGFGLWIGFRMDDVDYCGPLNEPPVSSTGMIPDLCTIIEWAMYTVPSGPETFLVHGHPITDYFIDIAITINPEIKMIGTTGSRASSYLRSDHSKCCS